MSTATTMARGVVDERHQLNGCRQQIAAHGFSLLQNVITILL